MYVTLIYINFEGWISVIEFIHVFMSMKISVHLPVSFIWHALGKWQDKFDILYLYFLYLFEIRILSEENVFWFSCKLLTILSWLSVLMKQAQTWTFLRMISGSIHV